MVGPALRLSPRPVWRVPAALLATVRVPFDREGRRLSGALLRALGRRDTRAARWRLHWLRAYQREAELLLFLQAARLTIAWARTHVRWNGVLPDGGAVLVSPHHAGQGPGALRLASECGCLGGVGVAPETFMRPDGEPSMRELIGRSLPIRERAFGQWCISPEWVARDGPDFLRAGGYLVITGDDFYYPNVRPVPLLGRAYAVPRGAAWLSRRTGAPIVPYMTVPHRGGWRVWIGDPVPPTRQGIVAALEASIRRAPQSWLRTMAMVWHDAPPAGTVRE